MGVAVFAVTDTLETAADLAARSGGKQELVQLLRAIEVEVAIQNLQEKLQNPSGWSGKDPVFKQYVTAVVRHVTETVPPNSPKWMVKECQQNVVSSSRMPEVLKVEEDTKYLDLSLRKHKSCEELRAEVPRLDGTSSSSAGTQAAHVEAIIRPDLLPSVPVNLSKLEIIVVESSDQNANELRRRESANLHTESTQDPVEEIVNTLTTPEKELFERSSQLFASVNASEGDYSNRAIDTRIKQTPTKSDLKTINKVINGLVAQNKVVPGENPFAYLWLANCVLYSVVVTFLVSKGWKKDPKDKATRRTHENDSWRNKFLEIVGEVRKKLSIATAELIRIKENRKLTKRGKKNRSPLQKECRSLSASSLVSYIEKQKSLLRKLKVSFGRKRRQEEAKVLSRQFKEDPGRVYATITMMAEEDPDNARPKYKVARNEDQTSASKGVFSDIVEAEGFWRRLWEERGTGDENAEWLKEIELAISQRAHDKELTKLQQELDIVREQKDIAIKRACADWIPVVSGMIDLQVLLAILLEVCTPNKQDKRDVEKLKFMQQDVVVNPAKALEKAMRR
ncbi:hypothetical protein P5673_004379 [Acropora cervicornis]|uniref:Uncharacterized protein n=1 Tax=Acropora cervicornis TaxID=6130 RepID=A0AAD9VDP0_ACRCE|nr:hypothetical protein P5673_004379 [Acropora cervicornis]